MGGGNKFAFAMVGGTLPHNMIFATYGSELEIVLKTSTPNDFQSIVDKIKELRTTKIHAYIEIFGVDNGRGPFLMLPNDSLNLGLLDKVKKDIMSYLMEYKKALMKDKLNKKPNLNELKQGFCGFKDKIKSVDEKLHKRLQGEFESFGKWIEFYFLHPKLALLLYRLKKLPYQLIKDFKRPFIKAFK